MTSPAPKTDAVQSHNKSIAYAEDHLGVHDAYSQALEARRLLDEAMRQLAVIKDQRRTVEQQLQDRELEIISDETGKHSSMSQAALDRHLKVVIPSDEQYRQIKSELAEAITTIEGLEYGIRMWETDVRIAVARMTELGGYLNYLSAVKEASKVDKP